MFSLLEAWRLDVLFDFLAHGCARFFDVVAALQAHPEVGAGAEEFGKAQGGVRGNAALFVEDGRDPVGGHVQRLGKGVCREF